MTDPLAWLTASELNFLVASIFSLCCGFLIGTERELRGKPAGISTNTLVIGAAMLFSHLSKVMTPSEPTRIAAQIVSGVGFLGAGIILKSETTKHVTFLTTAASIWFSAAIGMAIGFGYYFIAFVATLFAIIIPRIPHIAHPKSAPREQEDTD